MTSVFLSSGYVVWCVSLNVILMFQVVIAKERIGEIVKLNQPGPIKYVDESACVLLCFDSIKKLYKNS